MAAGWSAGGLLLAPPPSMAPRARGRHPCQLTAGLAMEKADVSSVVSSFLSLNITRFNSAKSEKLADRLIEAAGGTRGIAGGEALGGRGAKPPAQERAMDGPRAGRLSPQGGAGGDLQGPLGPRVCPKPEGPAHRLDKD